MHQEAIAWLVLAVGACMAVAAALHRRRERRATRPHISPLTPVRRRASRRSVGAYAATIRHQPALTWKLASFSAFSAGYLTDHSAAQWLVLVAVTLTVGFPLGYVIWRYRR